MAAHLPGARLGIYSYGNIMKTPQDIAFGFVIFFIIDRISRLASAYAADRKGLSELQTEKLRCSVELGLLLAAFAVLINK